VFGLVEQASSPTPPAGLSFWTSPARFYARRCQRSWGPVGPVAPLAPLDPQRRPHRPRRQRPRHLAAPEDPGRPVAPSTPLGTHGSGGARCTTCTFRFRQHPMFRKRQVDLERGRPGSSRTSDITSNSQNRQQISRTVPIVSFLVSPLNNRRITQPNRLLDSGWTFAPAS